MGERKNQLVGFIEAEYPNCSWRLLDCIMHAMLHREECIVNEDGDDVQSDMADEEIENGIANDTAFAIDGGHLANRFENGYGSW